MSIKIDYAPMNNAPTTADSTGGRMIERIIAYPGGEGNAWADAREYIVRCRDCKHMHTVRSWLGMDVDECWLHADHESGAIGRNRTEPDGFCAWGVRKGDAE